MQGQDNHEPAVPSCHKNWKVRIGLDLDSIVFGWIGQIVLYSIGFGGGGGGFGLDWIELDPLFLHVFVGLASCDSKLLLAHYWLGRYRQMLTETLGLLQPEEDTEYPLVRSALDAVINARAQLDDSLHDHDNMQRLLRLEEQLHLYVDVAFSFSFLLLLLSIFPFRFCLYCCVPLLGWCWSPFFLSVFSFDHHPT